MYLYGLLVLVLAVWAALVYNVLNLDDGACLHVEPRVPGWPFVVPGILGLLVGRYSGALRFVRHWPDEIAQPRSDGSGLVGRIALAIILVGLMAIFLYEAVGVYQPPNGLEPITYYVRCAIWIDNAFGGGVRTVLIIFFISFLFGQWLWAWHPADHEHRGGVRPFLSRLGEQLATKTLADLPRPRLDERSSSREGGAADANQS